MKTPAVPALIIALLVVACGLRLWSFEWNQRLQGDVNLFALTAREFVRSGEFAYPIKYEFSDNVDYCESRSFASQHPPLFPLAAGVAGSLLGTDETFFLLKLLSALGGLTLLGLFARRALVHAEPGATAALAFVAVSPSLVDFSSNGSPYVWSAVLLLLATRLIARIATTGMRGYCAAGFIAAIAPQLHTSLAAIPASLILAGLIDYRRVDRRGAAWFFGTAGLVATPYFAWNTIHFGSPLYTYNQHVLLTNLGLAQEGIWGDVVTWRWVDTSWWRVARQVMENAASGIRELGQAFFIDGGPGAALLATGGLVALTARDRRRTWICLLPSLLYVAAVVLLPFRDRFVLPLLPLAYLVAGVGFASLWSMGQRILPGACVVATVAWAVPAYFESPPTRYYANDGPHQAAYQAMLPVAQRFARFPKGPTLARTWTLDGGLEAAYHHGHPVIRGQPHGNPREERPGLLAQKLARDFHARYVWTDVFSRDEVLTWFPSARQILGNGNFFVFEIPEADRNKRGVCDAP